MFGGIGGSEIVIIAVLFLVIFGPSKLPEMARDIGRFVSEARRSIDEFKNELTVESDSPTRRRESPRRPGSVGKKATSDDNAVDTAADSTDEDVLSENGHGSSNGSDPADSETSKSGEPELRDL